MVNNGAVPPFISDTESYGMLQVNQVIQGGSPAFDWNEQYNQGQILTLVSNNTVTGNFDINFYKQPFNYIKFQILLGSTAKLVINNAPPMWIILHNEGTLPVTVSPQINGSIIYDATNEYTVTGHTHKLMAISPGKPPLDNAVPNPSTLELV